MTTTHRLTGLALTLAVTAALVACTPTDDPTGDPTTTTSSASATTEPSAPVTEKTTEELAAEAKATNIQAAKDLVIAYHATFDEVAAAGFADWEARLSPFWGSSEVIANDTAVATQWSEAGRHTTGQVKIEALTVTDYKGDPASATDAQQVYLEGCLDVSATHVLNADGTEVTRDPSTSLRYMQSWKVERIVGEWKIVTDAGHLDQPC